MSHTERGEGKFQAGTPPRIRGGQFFKTDYAEVKDRLFKVAEDTHTGYRRDLPSITEKTLYEIWMGRHIKHQGLKTVKGREIEILAPGWWSPGPGPDFGRAEIVIDGHPLKGDVEIDLRSSDWEAHVHHTDSGYNNVILHVVLQSEGQGREPLRQDGTHIPELALLDHLDRPLAEFIHNEEKESSHPPGSEPGT